MLSWVQDLRIREQELRYLAGTRFGLQLCLGIPLGCFVASIAGSIQLLVTFIFQDVQSWEEALMITWPGQALGMVLQSFCALLLMIFIDKKIAYRATLHFDRRYAWREFFFGSLIGGGIIVVVIIVLSIFGFYTVTGVSFEQSFWTTLLFSLGTALGEEVLLRGVVLCVLIARIGICPALVVTSFLFGFLHVGNPNFSVLGAIAVALQAGILFGVAYIVTGRLWFVVGIHASWNFVQAGIFGLNVSGVSLDSGLLEGWIYGPEWLTGGELGLEGSVITVFVSCIVSFVLLVRLRKVRLFKRGR